MGYGINELARTYENQTFTAVSLYERIANFMGDGLLEDRYLSPEEWQKSIDLMIERGRIKRGELSTPEKTRRGYRLTENGLREWSNLISKSLEPTL